MSIAVLTSMPTAQEYQAIIVNFLPIILLVFIFYFLLIRPQKKRDKAEKDMRNSIEIGDEISTIGGIVGKVVGIHDEMVTIESTSNRTKLKVYRWAIRAKETANHETSAPDTKNDPSA